MFEVTEFEEFVGGWEEICRKCNPYDFSNPRDGAEELLLNEGGVYDRFNHRIYFADFGNEGEVHGLNAKTIDPQVALQWWREGGEGTESISDYSIEVFPAAGTCVVDKLEWVSTETVEDFWERCQELSGFVVGDEFERLALSNQ